jgi:hypothetical protein
MSKSVISEVRAQYRIGTGMMQKKVILMLLFACGTAQNAHAGGWACTIEEARGYERDLVRDEWVVMPIKKPYRAKYVIKKTEKGGADLPPSIRTLPHEYSVYDKPELPPLAYCGPGKMKSFVCNVEPSEYGLSVGPSYAISFDPKSLQIMAAFLSKYVSMIEIGTCFPI